MKRLFILSLFLMMILGTALYAQIDISIGTGTVTDTYLPVNTLWNYSYSQTIYLQSEIDVPNQCIEKIAYHWNAAGSGNNNNQWTIYMGHTDESGFATNNWIPYTNITQVYSGTVNFPSAAGWMEIELTTPFAYNNVQNLVIAIVEDSPGYSYGGSFLNTVAVGRSIRCSSDSEIPSPINPLPGTLQGHYPNITMTFGDLPPNPVFAYNPMSMDFGSVLNATTSDPQNLVIFNGGSGTINLSAANISMFGINANEFNYATDNLPAALGAGQSVIIPITVTPASEGPLSAILRIMYDGTNYDVSLSAIGLPAGLMIIGDGTAASRFPLGSYYGFERSAALYTADEIGGGNKRISNIGWYANLAHSAAVPTKIYMRSYPGATITGSNWDDFTSNATLVYDDIIQGINPDNWHVIQLENTFDLDNGDNLLVLVERNAGDTGAGTGSDAPGVRATTMAGKHHTILGDWDPPAGNSSSASNRPNIMLLASSYEITNPPNPALLVSPANEAEMAALNTQLNWGAGGGAPTGYKLYFGDSNPPDFIGDLGNETTFNPGTLTTSTTYYWQVIPYNANGEATGCPVWSFTTLPDGLAVIGTGTTRQDMPVSAYYVYTYSQSIYLQGDINIQDQRIEKIAYYWNGAYPGNNSNEWVVYMGHTDMEVFGPAYNWIPIGQLTQVFAGTLDLPAVPGWIEIELQEPFVYNNVQNLVIAVDENKPGWDSNNCFFYNTETPGVNRSIRAYSDSSNPDPANPPTGATQVFAPAFPNIMITFGELPDTPVFGYGPTSIDFGSVMNATPSAPQNVFVSNTSGGVINLTADDISIFGTNADQFSFGTDNLPAAIGPGLSVTIPVIVTASIEGPISATLRIVYEGANYDVALSAEGLPPGITVIGNGTSPTRYPLGSYYGFERSAALYTAEEIGAGNKRISDLSWYASIATNVAIPTVIYLKSYPENTLTATPWADLIAGATLVYEDTQQGISANEWKTFQLDNTFDLDNGNNLLVLVERSFGGGGNGTSAGAGIYGTMASGVHRYYQQDSTAPTGNGTDNGIRPNLKFLSTSYELTDPPNPAFAVAPADGATNVVPNAILNWVTGGGAPTGYYLYFGESNPPDFVGDMEDATTYDPGTLEYSTTYYWQVIPYNATGNAENCPIWSFTTMDDPTVALPWEEDFTGILSGELPLNWTRTHANWSVQNTEEAGGTTPELRLYWTPSATDQLRVITPPLFGNNIGGYNLEFKHYLDHYNTPYEIRLEYSTNLENWNTLWALHNPNEDVGPETVHVPLPNSLIGTSFYLAWTFDGYSYNINNWYIDDIRIIAILDEPPAPPVLVSPLNGATDLPKTGFDLVWTPDLENGGVPTQYTVYIADNEDEIFDQSFFEITDVSITQFNPITDGSMVFNFNDRWFWTVTAANSLGECDVSGISVFRFDIQADPTVSTFPWHEGFEDTSFPPLGWMMVDGDGDGNNWFWFNGDGGAHGGIGYACSASYLNNVGTLYPDNWLITPPIAIPETGDYLVEFYIGAQDANWPEENYGFYVSTTGTAPTDFSLLWEETLEAGDWQHKSQNLQSYAGQTVRFAFRHFDCSDWFYLKLDDVQVREIPLDPSLNITPMVFDFGVHQLMNPSTPKTFTLSNNGAGSININDGDIWLEGDVADFVLTASDLPAELIDNVNYNLSVQFIPQSLGAKAAILKIQDNITREVHLIDLSGEAVEEPIASVILLEGSLQGADAARLEWASVYGDPTQPGYVHWDDAINRGAVGAGENQYHVAVMFGSEVTDLMTDMVLDHVMIHVNEEPQTIDYLKVWSGTNASLTPSALLYEQAVSGLSEGWNYIELSTPVPVASEAIFVGYHVNGIAGVFPASTDDLPAVDGRGNLVELGGWMTLVNANIAGNWLIHPHFEHEISISSRKRIVQLRPESIVANTLSLDDLRHIPLAAREVENMDRALRGFNIYRDGVQINTNIVAAYSYLDENLASGTYDYAVQAVHYSALGPVSAPVQVAIPLASDPFTLPFLEDWASEDFATNLWTVNGNNWDIVDDEGVPEPALEFSWYPRAQNYDMTLTSYNLDGTGIDEINLSFDIALYNYDEAYNAMAWEIWDGTQWQQMGMIDNQDGDDIDWFTVSQDISEHAANRVFKLRFRAFGEDTYDIDGWYIDNIRVGEPEDVPVPDPVTGLSISVSGNDVELNWDAAAPGLVYAVYASDNPYDSFEVIGTVNENSFTVPMGAASKQFYYVTIVTEPSITLPNLNKALKAVK